MKWRWLVNRQFLCIYDFDTKLYQSSLMLSDKYIIAKHKQTGREKMFKSVTDFHGGNNKKEIAGWLKKENEQRGTNFKKEDFEIIDKYKRNSTGFDKACVTMSKAIREVREKPWCRELKLIIGGKDNFRKLEDPSYKSSRKDKPCEFSELKKWLIETYPRMVTLSDYCESDDVLSIYSHWCTRKGLNKDTWDVCLVHRDKDMLQCRGFYWNFHTKQEEPIWVTQDQANRSLYIQVLQGDSTDDILGLEAVTPEIWEEYKLRGRKYGVGKGNAKKLLEDCKTEEDMRRRVQFLYEDYYGKEWKFHLNLNYKMVKLLEKKDEIKDFPFIKT